MRKFFKKNIIWLSLALLLGIILGLLVSYFWLSKTDFWNQKGLIQSNYNENAGAQDSLKEIERTIIDGVILNIDLSRKNIEIHAVSFAPLSDLAKTISIDEDLIINISNATEFSSVGRENKQEKTIQQKDLTVNDSVAIIVSQDLIDSSLKENLVADIIKVIK